ncbi:ribose transport system substrate-binding protein [Paenibacillus tianmuensis]|uniref:Ribose transport system substrate-binding protein n=1 Tax=Paenibacillus tianmuensis TaxID=624147 RepID=A0A1G4RYY3_9BACL|nr:substrate-binding domain-containing protein [Paenibacillus tianmuensis]SCW61956.1 ribose transport system substrate-binding protein [Paenibacillus tianmuensis]
MLTHKKIVWMLIPLLALCVYAAILLQSVRTESGKDKSIIVIMKSNDIRTEFWQTVRAGAKTAAKEFQAKADIRGPLQETDVHEQIGLVEQAIAEKPQAIVLAPAAADLLIPVAEKVRQAGIKLVVIDSPLDSNLGDSFIASNNLDAGRKAGRALASMTNGQPAVAILSDKNGSPTATDRETGIREALAANPAAVVAGTGYTTNQEERAYQVTKQLLADYPEINGVICLNETATLGAAKAIKELNKGAAVKLVGFGASIYEIKLLEEGALHATLVQKPFNLGYLGVKTAVELIDGRKANPRDNIDSTVVTKENMYDPENQKLLFPFVER